MKTKALTKEKNTILILPSLVEAVGFNEAIFLSQLHHLLTISKNEQDGFVWVWNSAKEWEEIFKGIMKEWTIRQTIYGLERQEIIVSDCFNKKKSDQTKWYRIDYEKLVSLYPDVKWSVEIQQANCGKSTAHLVKSEQPIPDTTNRELNNKLFNISNNNSHNLPTENVGYNPEGLKGGEPSSRLDMDSQLDTLYKYAHAKTRTDTRDFSEKYETSAKKKIEKTLEKYPFEICIRAMNKLADANWNVSALYIFDKQQNLEKALSIRTKKAESQEEEIGYDVDSKMALEEYRETEIAGVSM